MHCLEVEAHCQSERNVVLSLKEFLDIVTREKGHIYQCILPIITTSPFEDFPSQSSSIVHSNRSDLIISIVSPHWR